MGFVCERNELTESLYNSITRDRLANPKLTIFSPTQK